MSFGEDALREFRIALDDVEANLGFVSTASRLRPRLGGVIGWQSLDAPAKKLVQDFVQQKNVELALIYRGLFTLIAGGFEEFVRRLVREVVTVVNQSTKNYNELSESMRIQNMIRTGHALTTVAEPPDHLVIDYDALCKNIGTCAPDSQRFTLNADAFTLFVYSVSPSHLTEVFKRVGIELQRDDFGRAQGLRSVLGTAATRETANASHEFLRKFIQTRNKISHTGSGGVAVSETDVEQAVRFFRAFSSSLVELVQGKLEQQFGKNR